MLFLRDCGTSGVGFTGASSSESEVKGSERGLDESLAGGLELPLRLLIPLLMRWELEKAPTGGDSGLGVDGFDIGETVRSKCRLSDF